MKLELTGFDYKEERRQIWEKIDHLGGKLMMKTPDSKFPDNLDALIVDNLITTEKLVSGLAAGVPLLEKRFITDSYKDGTWLDFDQYDLGNARFDVECMKHKINILPLEERKKIKQDGGVFKDWRVVILIENQTKRLKFAQQIKLGGGEYISWTARHLTDASVQDIGRITHIFTEPCEIRRQDFGTFIEKKRSCPFLPPIVGVNYIRHYLTKFPQRRVDEFSIFSEGIIDHFCQDEDDEFRDELKRRARELDPNNRVKMGKTTGMLGISRLSSPPSSISTLSPPWGGAVSPVKRPRSSEEEYVGDNSRKRSLSNEIPSRWPDIPFHHSTSGKGQRLDVGPRDCDASLAVRPRGLDLSSGSASSLDSKERTSGDARGRINECLTSSFSRSRMSGGNAATAFSEAVDDASDDSSSKSNADDAHGESLGSVASHKQIRVKMEPLRKPQHIRDGLPEVIELDSDSSETEGQETVSERGKQPLPVKEKRKRDLSDLWWRDSEEKMEPAYLKEPYEAVMDLFYNPDHEIFHNRYLAVKYHKEELKEAYKNKDKWLWKK